jgi:hypothetical protein
VKKMAQNVAQPVLVKINTQLVPWKIAGQKFGLKNLPKVNRHPKDDKLPNLVTLAVA